MTVETTTNPSKYKPWNTIPRSQNLDSRIQEPHYEEYRPPIVTSNEKIVADFEHDINNEIFSSAYNKERVKTLDESNVYRNKRFSPALKSTIGIDTTSLYYFNYLKFPLIHDSFVTNYQSPEDDNVEPQVGSECSCEPKESNKLVYVPVFVSKSSKVEIPLKQDQLKRL